MVVVGTVVVVAACAPLLFSSPTEAPMPGLAAVADAAVVSGGVDDADEKGGVMVQS